MIIFHIYRFYFKTIRNKYFLFFIFLYIFIRNYEDYISPVGLSDKGHSISTNSSYPAS